MFRVPIPTAVSYAAVTLYIHLYINRSMCLKNSETDCHLTLRYEKNIFSLLFTLNCKQNYLTSHMTAHSGWFSTANCSTNVKKKVGQALPQYSIVPGLFWQLHQDRSLCATGVCSVPFHVILGKYWCAQFADEQINLAISITCMYKMQLFYDVQYIINGLYT